VTKPSRVKQFILSVAPFTKGEGPEHRFGWVIDTSSQGMIEDNATELGLSQHAGFWDTINADVRKLERNCILIIESLICSLREEGHTADDSLVGTGWLHEGGSAWKTWAEWSTEPIKSYAGLATLWKGSDQMLWAGVSEVGQSVLGCSFRFMDEFPGPTQNESKRLVQRLIGRG